MICELFAGTAIWVYCITPVTNTIPPSDSPVDITFTLNGHVVGNYTHQAKPDVTGPYEYNVTVYHNASLLGGRHELVMAVRQKSRILFDWAMYQ